MSLIEILFKYREMIKDNKKREATIFLQAAATPEIRLAVVQSINEDGRFITGGGQIFTNFSSRTVR